MTTRRSVLTYSAATGVALFTTVIRERNLKFDS
jgi:hypothetical protein